MRDADCPCCKKYQDKDGNLIPNEETLKAIDEINSGKGKSFETVEELFRDLEE